MNIRRTVSTVALGCVVGCCAAVAQDYAARPVPMNSDQVHRWLVGSDPLMIAWGAYFTAKNRDTSAVPYLVRLAEAWMPLLPQQFDVAGHFRHRTEEESARYAEMAAVLDALIQMRATVPPKAIEGLMPDFQSQALTLFALMPEDQRRVYAEQVYARRQPGADYSAFPYGTTAIPLMAAAAVPGTRNAAEQMETGKLLRVAAAILALKPPPGFAASLLNESTVELEVTIGGKDPEATIKRLGGACVDAIPMGGPRDWPEPSTYIVEQVDTSWRLPEKEAVIVPGLVPLTTRRSWESSTCNYVQPFSNIVRVQLLTQLVGVPLGALGWATKEYVEVSANDDAALRSAVQKAVDAREKASSSTVAALVKNGLMTAAEAENARPTLRVKIYDARETRTPALHEMRLEGAKVVMEE